MPHTEPNRAEVIVAGHMCLDIIPQLSHSNFAFLPGALEQVGPAKISLGGCVSNTGLALKKLGASVQLVSRIGQDAIGELVRLELGKFGQSSSGLSRTSDSDTSYTVILSPPDRDRMFLHHPGANDSFCANDVAAALEMPAKIFHFGYPPLMRKMYEAEGRELERVFCMAKGKGMLTSLDMAYPDPDSDAGRVNWREIAARVLPQVDVFFPSFEEMVCMFKPELAKTLRASDAESPKHFDTELLRHLGEVACQMGAAVVAIKLGDQGLYVRTNASERFRCASTNWSGDWADRELWIPVFKTTVVGTTGAGDATGAGFLYGILRGFPIEHVCRIACAVGACNVEAADATSGIVPFRAIEERMKAGWEQQSCPARNWAQIAEGVFAGERDHDLRRHS